jgi:hypothetical protein
MTRSRFASLCCIASLAFLSSGAQAQNSVNATGNWNVTTSGEIFATGALRLEQTGSTVVGSYGQSGRIDGTLQPGTRQVDAKWNDSRGSGWMTIIFTADGNGFSGDWGYPGSKPSGRFVASRLLPVYPPVTGNFKVSVTGGPEFSSRSLNLHQLGQTVVGNFGPGTQLGGTIAPGGNYFTGTWKGPSGDGWIKLQFTADSKAFQGEWGLTSDTQSHGSIVGSTINHTQLWVRGLWDIASSGGAFAGGALKLQQEGQTVIGSYKDGHLQGTLPRGSGVLTGRWRDPRGTGDLVFTFASDGKSFQGTWTVKGKSGGGRIIGKRVIASSPALRQ